MISPEALQYAGLASGAAACVGLLLTAYQIARARRVADLQALQEFFKTVRECERSLVDAGGDSGKQLIALSEWANLMEVYARAYRKRLFGPASREIVYYKLVDSAAMIERNPKAKGRIDAIMDSPTTFAEFTRFIRRNRGVIDARIQHRLAANK